MLKYAIEEDMFDEVIMDRGQEYYDNGLFGDIYNINSTIYADVNDYTVIIGPNKSYCSCPCNFNCKHLYALLLRIKNWGIPEDLLDTLRTLNKKELVQLIEKIIRRYADDSLNILKILSYQDNTVSDSDSAIDTDTTSDTTSDTISDTTSDTDTDSDV